jgi:hypothetical protein
MKLGILVVYLVAEEDERLLDIHLAQIEKTTTVPFRIYAAANRLLPRFRDKIEKLSYISICQIPTTEFRGSCEHAYYLDRLAKIAVDDGATCICTFHVDSFPLRTGWAERVTAELNENCVLAGIERTKRDRKPVTEFMIFTREFYIAHRPTFLLTESEMASAEYQRYAGSCPHVPDSGTGYGFKLWSQGLSWFPLKRVDSDHGRHPTGALYEDLFFHLVGASRDRFEADVIPSKIRVARVLSLLRVFAKAVVPTKLWLRLNRMNAVFRWAETHWARPLHGRAFVKNRNQLLADPERFLSSIESGRPWPKREEHSTDGKAVSR